MVKLLHVIYNMNTNVVELTYNDGSVLTIDCEEVENFGISVVKNPILW